MANVVEESMLTTSDNPFDPFVQFDEWKAFDEAQGYFTCAYLARIANVSESLTQEEYNTEISNAIDEIVRLNLTGNYVKVTRT